MFTLEEERDALIFFSLISTNCWHAASKCLIDRLGYVPTTYIHPEIFSCGSFLYAM